ncbi:hypothetical protein [Nannocystis sp.]|uniref:hypothetical protein n=1 Tax=Nannocystis sp. TaxID=1962667 RepID=UPI0025ED5600|nr:hypothetical protein [Nannocystis sp.]MBK7829840.1 hypothetical protein [Nannocystis sp.]
MRTKLLLSTLLCACLTACASAPAPVSRPAAAELACTGGPVLRPGDVAAVEPLWAANKLVKSPSYQLAGVIVELHPGVSRTRDDLQTAINCRSACALAGQPDLLALPGLHASLHPSSDHLTMILRSDDPATAREAMLRAETLLARR